MEQTHDPAAGLRLAALSHEIAFQAFQLVVALVFTAPLVADWVADWLGWRIFFLKDPHIQLVWATILLVAGGWPFIAGLRRDRGARFAVSLAVAAASACLYAYGVFLTFWRPAVVTHPFYQMQACVIAVVTLQRFAGAVVQRSALRRAARNS